MAKKMSYMECWKVLSKFCADVHFDCYKPSKARRAREDYAIGAIFEICQRADKKEEALKNA